MNEKMSFLEKMMYRIGLKDPTKVIVNKNDPRSNGSPLEDAVRQGDLERLDFFKKYRKMSPAVLASALMLVPSVDVLKKLEDMGANVSIGTLPPIIKSMAHHMTSYNCSDKDYRDNSNFFRENRVSMNFHDENGKTLYDGTQDKNKWFDVANPKEIGHELRQAVARGQFDKVQGMLETGKDKVDVNNMNANRCDAMNYALRLPEEQAEKMAKLLFDHGAKLDALDSDGNNALQRAKPAVKEMLIRETIRTGNISGLNAIKNAGIKLDKPEYLLLTNDVDVLTQVAKLGASVEMALQTVRSVDENTWGTEENVAQLNALLKVEQKLKPEEKQPANTQDMSSSIDKQQEALSHEFRKAVANNDYNKVQDMIDNSDDKPFDINAVNKQGRSAISYAYQNNDLKMAFMLYHNGAKLDGEELYKHASVEMRDMLSKQCEQQRDVAGIDAIMQCINSKDPSNWEDRKKVMSNALEYNRLKQIKEDIVKENATAKPKIILSAFAAKNGNRE